jgi:hypothetical protein
MSEAETCVTDGCRSWPQFPDRAGYQFCRDCYPEPNGGTFEHVPDEQRRNELQEQYNL